MTLLGSPDGGWTKAHPIPSDKGSVGNFGLLADENRQIIQRFLEGEVGTATESESSYDHQILKKLRGLYGSCMNEKKLNQRGIKPLLKVVEEIQTLFRHGPDRAAGDLMDRRGLTAAVTFLHSRGIGGLFNFYLDGDIKENPDMMTLWFGRVFRVTAHREACTDV
jgi:endothelin-converting enzyme